MTFILKFFIIIYKYLKSNLSLIITSKCEIIYNIKSKMILIIKKGLIS